MRVSVHIYPASAGGASRRAEAIALDMPCGAGEQIVRWLAHAACLRLAYEKRDLAKRFVPQAVIGRDGAVLDAEHVLKEVRGPTDGRGCLGRRLRRAARSHPLRHALLRTRR